MPRETLHTWWTASLTTAAVVLCACAGEGENPAAGDEQNVEADPSSSRDAGDQDGSEDASSNTTAMSGDDAQISDLDGSAGSSECPDAPAPLSEGELQNLASGPSIFGAVGKTDLGPSDPLGPPGCGIEGARICLFGTDKCTETDAAGQFVLEDLPDDIDLEISIEKDGFTPAIRLVHLQGAPVFLRQTSILPDADRAALNESVDQRDDEGLGSVVVVPLAPGEAVGSVSIPEGVQITLMPGDASPFYARGALEPGSALSSGELDPSLDATRERGWAVFIGVEPGDYTVRFERDGTACSTVFPGFGFGVDELGHVRIRVRAGFTTSSIAALCP